MSLLSLVWLALTVLPNIFVAGFVLEISFLDGGTAEPAEPGFFEEHYWPCMISIWSIVAVNLILVIVLQTVPGNLKLPWILGILFLSSMGAMQAFWYLHMWRPLSSGRAPPRS